MKIKTSELIGPALDWAAATCEGYVNLHRRELKGYEVPTTVLAMSRPDGGFEWVEFDNLDYNRDWGRCGPIIEREGIDLSKGWHAPGTWTAWPNHMNQTPEPMHGPTPLIAAMRCYVASKMGDEIEVPEELK